MTAFRPNHPACAAAVHAITCLVLLAWPVGCSNDTVLPGTTRFAVIDLRREFYFEEPTILIIQSDQEFDALWNHQSVHQTLPDKPSINFESFTAVFVSLIGTPTDHIYFESMLEREGIHRIHVLLHSEAHRGRPYIPARSQKSSLILVPKTATEKLAVGYDVLRGKTQTDRALETLADYKTFEYLEYEANREESNRELICGRICQ